MPPTGGGRWASRKSAVRDLLIFPVSIFSSSVPNTPHRSQKHCGYPTLKEALDQNSRLPRTQLQSLTMDGSRKRPKPGFFLQKKSKLSFTAVTTSENPEAWAAARGAVVTSWGEGKARNSGIPSDHAPFLRPAIPGLPRCGFSLPAVAAAASPVTCCPSGPPHTQLSEIKYKRSLRYPLLFS